VIDQDRDPVQPVHGEVLPPETPGHEPFAIGQAQPRPRRTLDGLKKNAGPGLVGLGVLAAKAKVIFTALFALKWLFFIPKFALTFISIGASLWLYATLFGLKLGIVFILLLLMHELGHFYAFRMMGMKVSLPVFVPGFGAFVTVPQAKTMTLDALGALAGPLLGSAAAAICYVYGVSNGDEFWIACAHVGFFLNLFNLAPVPPLDGGRVIAVLSPRLWLVGIVGALGVIFFTHAFSPITSLLLVLLMLAFLPRAWAAFKGRLDPTYLAVPLRDRILIGGAYFALAALLAVGMHYTTPIVPGQG
jgi:Zn-dependent protease